jgi:phosphoglycolate phosphatase
VPRTVCIFDFDGTICDSLSAFVAALNKVFTDFGYPETSAAQIRTVPARAGLAKVGVPLVKLPFLARRIRRELSLRLETLATFPEIPEVLRELGEAHTLLVVTSNGKSLVECKRASDHGVTRLHRGFAARAIWLHRPVEVEPGRYLNGLGLQFVHWSCYLPESVEQSL